MDLFIQDITNNIIILEEDFNNHLVQLEKKMGLQISLMDKSYELYDRINELYENFDDVVGNRSILLEEYQIPEVGKY